MTKSDRPTLGLDIEFQIETAQNQTHINFWPQLQQLQEPRPEVDKATRNQWPMIQFQPPAPKRPHALRRVLANYASLLFESEAAFYPNDDQLLHWLSKLAERIEARVFDAVAQIEELGIKHGVSLKHHGLTLAEMRQAMATSIEEPIKARLAAALRDQVKAHLANALHPEPTSAITTTARETKPKRISATIHCPKAARKMEDYIAKKGLDQTKFAIKAGTTDRTLRRFRKTGRIKRSIFEEIAKAMGTTKEALLNE